MVRNSAREASELSPSCRERIYVTDSKLAMGEDVHGESNSNHRKFPNLNVSYENRLRPTRHFEDENCEAAVLNAVATPTEPCADGLSSQGAGAPNQPTPKKKPLHKLATGALANIGLLFAGASNVDDLTGGSKVKASEACSDSNDPNVEFTDTGLQTKLTQKEKFFGKPWRSRQKLITTTGNSLWTPNNDCQWSSGSGSKVQLTDVNLDELSRPESIALQHISLAKLRKFHLRSEVLLPKDSHSQRKSIRRAFSLKNRVSGINLFDKDKDKDSGVFAVPLSKAVAQIQAENNTEEEKASKSKTSKAKSVGDEQDGDVEERLRMRRHSSSSLHQSIHNTVEPPPKKNTTPNKSSNDSPKWKSRLIDALSLVSSPASASCLGDKQSDCAPVPPQVPLIVQKAIEHLEHYGLHVLGIFRVAGSKKRMKQMRELFDSGEKIDFTAEDNPHDVAALFKEYFRDLPEPLLTRELYSVFLETLNEEDKRVQALVLRLLCCLLPIPNRDTLKSLLEFLAKVAHYSEDTLDEKGNVVPGNQMTSRNLATLIGPNILHKVKGQHHDYLVEDMARAEEREEVIDVVHAMIEQRSELFKITAEDHHEILVQLLESSPEIVDFILKRKAGKSKRKSSEVDEVFHENGEDKENGQESRRARTIGEAERPLSRAASAPTSRPSANLNVTTRERRNPREPSPVPPVRSYSLNQQEAILYRNRIMSRMQSFPNEPLGGTFHGSYRENRRRTPPPMRAARVYRYGDTSPREMSEPPSPALSSTSWSNYSTPPSSPSGSTQYVSAESSLSHSPMDGSYFGDETPTKARLTCVLNEVGVEVPCGDYNDNDPSTEFNHFKTEDVQLERWTQWESIAQQGKTRKEMEQETLV